ncbi:MAG: BTAD domain-containing putative transcriptional regulator, partial [Gemmatimonadales bacterium]
EAGAPNLRLRTFGAPVVEGLDGASGGTAAQPQSLALLVLLAAAGERGMSRDKIVALLWPECDDKRARHRLSQLCHALRRSLGDGIFSPGNAEIHLDSSRIGSDVAEFKAACLRGESELAVACYGGPFLDGFFLSGAPEFERWVEAERVTCARAFTEALETLAIEAEARGNRAEAARWWSKLAEHEPLSSRVIIRLMSALAAHGDRAGALESARRYEEGLNLELEASPNPAVLALADRLRQTATVSGSALVSPRARICIALLPFTKLGSMPETYLAEGLVEDLRNGLAGLEAVRVTAVGSLERLPRPGPSAILEGIIRQVGNRVRLIVRLLDTSDGSYLWSNRYDRVVEDVLTTQDDLSQAIVADLQTFLRL